MKTYSKVNLFSAYNTLTGGFSWYLKHATAGTIFMGHTIDEAVAALAQMNTQAS